MSKQEMKSYEVFCIILTETDYGLLDFTIKVDAIHITDAAHKVESLLEGSKTEYEMREIQRVER